MNQGFWSKLKKPIMVLAPMADVTDAAFRRVIAKYGKPDVIWTEFVSADGLIRATDIGKQKLLRDLMYAEAERPIVAQLFSGKPEYMKQAAALCRELGFDGVDINMGCPDSGIEKQGAGAAMIKNPKLAREVIRAAKEGAGDLPVSVKTRVGFNKIELETWLPELLAEEPAVITVHARTRKEMSKVPARWEHVKRAVEIRDELQKDLPVKTLIFGNGDALNLEDGYKKIKETGADGIMFGRAIFGNPWLFAGLTSPGPSTVNNAQTTPHPSPLPIMGEGGMPTLRERLLVMLEHTKLFEELLGDIKSFHIMKKHYKAYVAGFDGAAELRNELMNTDNYTQVEEIVNRFINAKK